MAANSLFTLEEIATQVALNVGDTSDYSITLAKQWVNRALLRFMEMGTWSWQHVYGGTVNTVAGTATITLTGILKMESLFINSPMQRKLILIEDRKFRAMYPNATATGAPYYYRVAGNSLTTVNTLVFGLYPIPDAVYTLNYDYIRPIGLLSADADDIRTTTGMPSSHVDLVIEMATAIGFKADDDEASSRQMEECMARLAAAYSKDQYQIEDRLVMAPMETDNIDSYFDPIDLPNFSNNSSW